MVVLDSCIVIDILRNRGESPTKILAHPVWAVSTTTVGELIFGALNAGNPSKHVQNVELFVSKSKILNVTLDVAEAYARIRKQLKDIGKPIPENDIWIAATAVAFDLKLITKDDHFSRIEGMKVELWQ